MTSEKPMPCPSGKTDAPGHRIFIEASGDVVRVICDCGWEGPEAANKAEAIEAWSRPSPPPAEGETPGLFEYSRMPACDENGMFWHPDLDRWIFDDEDTQKQVAERALRDGWQLIYLEMDQDYDDDNFAAKVKTWEPQVEDFGYMLVAKFDSEDGPCAILVRPQWFDGFDSALAFLTADNLDGDHPWDTVEKYQRQVAEAGCYLREAYAKLDAEVRRLRASQPVAEGESWVNPQTLAAHLFSALACYRLDELMTANEMLEAVESFGPLYAHPAPAPLTPENVQAMIDAGRDEPHVETYASTGGPTSADYLQFRPDETSVPAPEGGTLPPEVEEALAWFYTPFASRLMAQADMGTFEKYGGILARHIRSTASLRAADLGRGAAIMRDALLRIANQKEYEEAGEDAGELLADFNDLKDWAKDGLARAATQEGS